MKCCKCGRYPIEHGLSMYPIEPKGQKDRKWCCTECGITPEEKRRGQEKTAGLQAIIEANREPESEEEL